MADQEESKRISLQVSSLSTQLIESIDKQSRLEEQLLNANKTITSQKSIVDSYNEMKTALDQLKLDYERDKTKFDKQQEICADAEKKVASLNQEIEDLTASLFDEANNMVVDARKEKNAIEILNGRLQEQLKEKDLLLETLSIQLKNLKTVLYKLENDNNASKRISLSDSAMSSTTSIDRSTTNQTLSYETVQSQGVLYSPLIHSLRYDVPLYAEYLKFLAVLPNCETLQQTSSDSKLIRRLVNYEITPVLRLDNASGVGWLLKRNLLNLMMEGSVSIEPISGINETYRTGYSSPSINDTSNAETKNSHLFSRPVNSPPVAMLEPCAFCSEQRDDILEHGRLYILKTLQKNEHGENEVTNQFPLCHYCLLKIRQVCEIFAFLRSLKSGVWNLEKLSLASIRQGKQSKYAQVSKTLKSKSKRMSIFQNLKQSQTATSSVTENISQFADRNGLPTTNIQRSWARLSQLRASLLWSHIGVWSLDDALQIEVAPTEHEKSNDSVGEEQEQGLGITTISGLPVTLTEDESFDFENKRKSQSPTDNSLELTITDDNEITDNHVITDDNGVISESKSERSLKSDSQNENENSSIPAGMIEKFVQKESLIDEMNRAVSEQPSIESTQEPDDFLEAYHDSSMEKQEKEESPSDDDERFDDANEHGIN